MICRSTTVGSKIYLIGGQESLLNRFSDIFEFDTGMKKEEENKKKEEENKKEGRS